jgi:hypothetical protein
MKKRGLIYNSGKVLKFEAGFKVPGDSIFKDFNYDTGMSGSTDARLSNYMKDENKRNSMFKDIPKNNAFSFGNSANSFKEFQNFKTELTKPSNFSSNAIGQFNSNGPINFNKSAGNLGSKNGYNLGATAESNIAKAENYKVKPVSTLKPARQTGAQVEAAGAALGTAGTALANITDGKDHTYTAGEKAGTVSGSILKSAAGGMALAGTATGLLGSLATTGAASAIASSVGVGGATIAAGAAAGSIVPIVGTIIGALVGVGIGVYKAKKAKKKAAGVQADMNRTTNAQLMESNRQSAALRDSLLAGSAPATSSVSSNTDQRNGYQSRKLGGSFYYTLKKSEYHDIEILIPVKKFKRGGSVKASENIIPNGVLHEEDNKLGDKGMPVVKCTKDKCVKKYEIEKEELIFTLDTTKQVEKLVKGGDLKELGTFVKDQVLNNTHSFTDKFNDLNNYKRKNASIYA